MLWKRCFALGLAVCMGGGAIAQAQNASPMVGTSQYPNGFQTTPYVQSPMIGTLPPLYRTAAQTGSETQPNPPPSRADLPGEPSAPAAVNEGAPADQSKYGPTPLTEVNILQNALFGPDAKDAWLHIAGWLDVDYNYRSSGSGINNVAPVMNRFGDEFEAREIGLYLYKPLDNKTWSWGFNCIFMAGEDAAFLTPTAGGWQNTNPRFGAEFNDLNVTAHLPILTDGGVDLKIGRQTTCLGPMGALAWQRPLNSSDYAWYNEEEGRYTGVSAIWYISKQLSWYNGVEIGGWGVFFDDAAHGVDYLTQVNYWLDEEAKKTKVWFTVLTGPTGFTNDGNTTVVEVGWQHNYTDRLYQIIDTQLTYSKAPIFFTPPPGYQERAYDVYTYLGYRLNKCWDVTGRVEWYDDVDGGGYPGGFGVPHTNYEEVTVGLDYHPVKWLQFRPEIRYDHADNDNFGPLNDKKNEVTIGADLLLKF
jgi:Putative beta-barrel porin-2, OmpL-like. bbp2